MKKIVLSFLLFSLITIPTAADYRIDWYTIDGGGEQSSGGSYVLIGSIGQPDAANSAAQNCELLGGFWSGGPLCFIDFPDFALFAAQWLETGPDLQADLDQDSDVDLNDLKMLAYQWLCLCPSDWPLK